MYVALLKWVDCSRAIWVTGSDASFVASRARSQMALFTRSKCEWTRIWTIKNVDKTTPGQVKMIEIRPKSTFTDKEELKVKHILTLISLQVLFNYMHSGF